MSIKRPQRRLNPKKLKNLATYHFNMSLIRSGDNIKMAHWHLTAEQTIKKAIIRLECKEK